MHHPHRISRVFSTALIVLFQLMFAMCIICYHDVISIAPRYLKPMSAEYWYWLLANPQVSNSDAEKIVYSIECFMAILLINVMLYIAFDASYHLKTRQIIAPFVCGLIAFGVLRVYVRYVSAHYYLPMCLVPTELLSLILLYLLVITRKKKPN